MQEYKYDIEEAILPNLREFRMPGNGKTPASLKDVKGELAPQNGGCQPRVPHKDDSIDKMRSLIDVQIQSYRWFLTDGLSELLKEISPIADFSGKKMELNFWVTPSMLQSTTPSPPPQLKLRIRHEGARAAHQ